MSIKQTIVEYLRSNEHWVFGGVIEDYIRERYGHKASNASRRCRELENSGILESRKVQIDGKGPYVVQYRIKREAIQQAFPVFV